ncbi:MAG: hypothetical protein WDM77_19670 [Steroidobacteraceae bacterium]
MGKNLRLGLLWATLTVLPLPVLAQTADSIGDIRCVAVGIRSAVMPDSHQKSNGTLLVLYYLGRLGGREPTLDIEKLLTDQIKKMTEADYASEATRCQKDLTTTGAQITRLGEDLQKRFTR